MVLELKLMIGLLRNKKYLTACGTFRLLPQARLSSLITEVYLTRLCSPKFAPFGRALYVSLERALKSPQPLDDPTHKDNIKSTPKKGFLRFDSYEELRQELINLLSEEREFFSGMKTKKELGKIIEIANHEHTYEKKAEVFLKLLRNENGK